MQPFKADPTSRLPAHIQLGRHANETQLRQQLIGIGIPVRMHDGICNYAIHHREAGGFLMAVFENNLMKAVGKADDENKHLIWEYCCVVHNHVPAACSGSPEAVTKWLEQD